MKALAGTALVVFCGFLLFFGLNTGEFYRNEGLRAILGAEVLKTGDWIVPRLYGEPILTKPPGMYMAIALASWPFGKVTEATARLPSSLAGALAIGLLFWQFQRHLGFKAGCVAAAFLPTSLMWLDKAPSAEIDLVQVGWVTVALLFFFRAVEEEESPAFKEEAKRTPNPSMAAFWWFLALLCVAGGVMTKWTAPAFFYGTAIPYLAIRKRLLLFFSWHHLFAALLGASLCLAWICLVCQQVGWQVFYETVSREALMRLSPAHHHRPYPWGETLAHPLILLGANLPWSLFALLTLRPGFSRLWDSSGQRLLQFLHCWTWPNMLFWSLIPDHASRHSMPLCPGLSGLAAMVWIAWLTDKMPWPSIRWRPIPAIIGVLLVWLGVKLAFVELVIPRRNGEKVPLLEIIRPSSKEPRAPRIKAQALNARMPPGETLYLFKLKDEGIMFYLDRRLVRLNSPTQLPSSGRAAYCIVASADKDVWPPNLPYDTLFDLTDEQGDPISLVMVHPCPR